MKTLVAAIFLGLSGRLFAYCEGGYPNIRIEQEIRASQWVIVATLTATTPIADPEDPEGYAATRLKVRVEKVLAGKPFRSRHKAYLEIFNPNTSDRFPLDAQDIGKRFVLFVSTGPDGYWVNSCGYSGEYAAGKVKTIRRLVHKHRVHQSRRSSLTSHRFHSAG